MKLLLVYPPPSSPTYIPLGIATIASWIGTHDPSIQVDVCDLNITLWEKVINLQVQSQEAAASMKSSRHFFDRTTYSIATDHINTVSDKVHKTVDQVKAWLEEKPSAADKNNLLEDWCCQILATAPDIIGFSVMYPLQIYVALALAKKLKEAGGPKVIFGGASISAFDKKELLLACTWVDAMIEGEGEQSLLQWLQGEDPSTIGGLVWRKQNTIMANPKPTTTTLNQLPPPDFSLFDLTRYLNPEPVLPIVFSRGCLWRKCRFCAHNFPFSGYRTKRYQQIVSELAHLHERYHCRYFYFADQYITAEDGLELAEAIIESGLDIRYHVMGRPSAEYNTDLLQKMYHSGCRWISWGIETGSDRLLALSNKGTNVTDIERVLKNAQQFGISNLAMMIFGLPTSTDDDLEETLRFYDHVWPVVDAFTTSRFQLFYRTGFASDPDRFELKITGREVVLNLKGKLVHSNRLFFHRKQDTESGQMSRALNEVNRWEKYRQWSRDNSFFETLVNEHYLLFAAHETDNEVISVPLVNPDTLPESLPRLK